MARRRKKIDPFATREAAKYEHPVPSREFILQQLEESGEPLPLEQIAADLGVTGARDLEAFQRRLNAMVRDGQIIRNRRDFYGPIDRMNLVRGRVVGHPDGFGFLVPDEVGEDLYLPPQQMRALLHEDRVVARIAGVDRRGRREAAVVEVLERANREVVGRFFIEGRLGFVDPENRRLSQDILIPAEHRGDARNGQIAVVEITEQPTRHAPPVGRIVEVLGDHMAPGMEIEIAIRASGMPAQWSPAVEAELADLEESVPESAIAGREDIRDLPLVTIDGEDARDFDDAVYCEPHGRGWRLVVAIADVSSYVTPGAALDGEALERGNSVYFPDRVIPMLPEVLSNGLCSLNPKVDRLCLACEMFITPTGRLSRYRFFEGVMWSHARLTYTEAAGVLVERDAKLRRRYRHLVPHLDDLYSVFAVLRRQRERRGAIDFDTAETRIVFGKERKIERIVPLVRNDAHRLIEECMIAANVAAADFLLNQKMPSLYRVHNGPGIDKLSDVREFLAEVGLSLGGGDEPSPKHYAKLLSGIRERPDRHLIETVLLRSLSQAVYSPENVGHFGLALDAYTHFTSPIRRYPDLLVHRAIRHLLAGRRASTFEYSHEKFVHFGEHCSMTERRADEATRDAIDWLKCEFMTDKVGDVYGGTVTAVTGFGLFVELDGIYVEGLVHISALSSDYYQHDPVHHRLLGERTRRVYRLADRVKVRVLRVDLDQRKIDFELVESAAKRKKTAKKRAGATTGTRGPRARKTASARKR